MTPTKKKRKETTILVVGDTKDFDSYQKLDKEKRYILRSGFDYRTINYQQLLEGDIPEIETEKVAIFFFFPFLYWDKFIEHKRYRGIYGNMTFYRKFNRFAARVVKIIKVKLQDKKILLINDPRLSAFYRDKVAVAKILSKAKVSVPVQFKDKHLSKIKRMLEGGYKLFIKPRCGSMGKGITFLQLGNWQTNFEYRRHRIYNRKSDYGWRFHDITGKTKFMQSLLHSKDLFMEEAIDPLKIKDDKIDFRVYAFLGKILYIYPRRNSIDAVTTNISQGGRGDPHIIDIIPKRLIKRIEEVVIKAKRALKLKFIGVDVVVDDTLKNIYIVDVNMFPGLPKRRTIKLARVLVDELKKLIRSEKIKFKRSSDL